MKKPNKRSWQYLQGYLAAITAVAEVTGKQPIDGMSEREWKLICDIQLSLTELGSSIVKAWEDR